MRKRSVITLIIIFGVILLSFAILNKSESNISKETAQCIGENSILYVQLECHACETQEKMFGDNYKHLNIFDCQTDWLICADLEIKVTPTWIINSQLYKGVQSIKELKELTGC